MKPTQHRVVRRGGWVAALSVTVLVLVVASCSTKKLETTGTTTLPSTTTTAKSSTTSSTAGSATTSTSGGGDTTTSLAESSWTLIAVEYRGENGRRVTIECSADGTPNSVWGTEIYTDDSSICTAAVHAGLIDFDDGGTVEIEIAPGRESYEGSTANGVTSSSYAVWDGSFTFVE